MEISKRRDSDGIHLTVTGELSIYSAHDLKQELLGALQEAPEVEVHLGGVTELDTAGLQLLYLAKREAVAHGGTLRLVEHSDATREVLDLLHLSPYFGDPVLIRGAAEEASR